MMTEDIEQPNYYLAEGVAGQGDKPDWLVTDRYKTVADQAAAYPEAQKRIGELTEKVRCEKGPDEYAINPPEGFDFNSEDPLYEQVVDYAKSINLSQSGFDDLISLYAQSEAARKSGVEQFYKDEVSKIDNYEARSKDIGDYLEANELSSLSGLITTAEQLEQFEKLLGMAGKAVLDPSCVRFS